MTIIGLTGGIGSGKSSAAEVFARLGAPVISADSLARTLLDTDPVVRDLISKRFGKKIYGAGDRADRRALAAVVFSNPAALRRLNAILHPRVRRETMRWIHRLPRTVPIAMIEAALLYEAGWESFCDYMVVVAAPREVRICRVQKRDRCSRREVLRRMKNQMSQKEKITRADVVILNRGSRSALAKQCRVVCDLFRTIAPAQRKQK
jgi:dephospho-CoA kinase